MTKDIDLAHEADCLDESHYGFLWAEKLTRFAALVAAAERDKWEAKFKQLEALMQVREQQPNKPCCLAEREACAKVCDAHESLGDGYMGDHFRECAAEIRARGKV
jgi:hypothetical protein